MVAIMLILVTVSAVATGILPAGNVAAASSSMAAPFGSITGSVWYDANGNGVWDSPAEPALAGHSVYATRLDDGVGVMTLTVLTADDGTFQFPILPYGEYRISDSS
ncbi:MAG: hypothetical protein D6706_21760, partial [Chloroflexi bacterium]